MRHVKIFLPALLGGLALLFTALPWPAAVGSAPLYAAILLVAGGLTSLALAVK